MARYEYSEVTEIRGLVEEQLPKPPPARGPNDATAAQFWSRVERAGLLSEALALYDEIAASRKRTRLETKRQFAERIEREGRQAEVERARADLLASGLTQRETQEELVKRFQPQDGTMTRAWETPDPWQQGRLFHKKAEQQRVLKAIERKDEWGVKKERVAEAENQLHWAKRRREERQALADARRRAWAIKQEAARPQREQQAARRGKPRKGQRLKSAAGNGRCKNSELI